MTPVAHRTRSKTTEIPVTKFHGNTNIVTVTPAKPKTSLVALEPQSPSIYRGLDTNPIDTHSISSHDDTPPTYLEPNLELSSSDSELELGPPLLDLHNFEYIAPHATPAVMSEAEQERQEVLLRQAEEQEKEMKRILEQVHKDAEAKLSAGKRKLAAVLDEATRDKGKSVLPDLTKEFLADGQEVGSAMDTNTLATALAKGMGQYHKEPADVGNCDGLK